MGYSKYEKEYKLLYIRSGNDKSQINQQWQLKNIIDEDKQRFSSMEEAEQSMRRKEDNSKNVHFICQFYGIVGFFKFLEGYYLLYIKEIQKIAKIGRHKLWRIAKTEVLRIYDGKNASKEEQQFKKSLSEYNMTEGFYSSYTYDLTNSLNRNMMRNAMHVIDADTHYADKMKLDRSFSSSQNLGQFNEMFTWNYYGVQEFYQLLSNKRWVLPIIHGFVDHKNLKSLNSSFSITLVSRRCRHHAGTRFSKRGINEDGFPANYVETEQIIVDLESTSRRPSCTSFVQIRGSAPVFWHQQPSLFEVKPAIQINECDPYYSATKKHFGDLLARYGEKIFCIDLVKSTHTQTNEEKLAQTYSQVVEDINTEIESKNQITYYHFDMKKQLKTDKTEYVEKSYTFAYFVVHQVGIFQVQDSKRAKIEQCVELQNGVLRSNCVDCLDRTNSFQQLVGEIALAIQLAKMYQSSFKFSELNVHEKVLQYYRAMFERNGDVISEQYGSSKAHKQNIKEQKTKWRFELLTSIQRHFKNNLSDSARQFQIDLFLGNFIPDTNQKTWQNPIKQFFPKDGYENLVFRSSSPSIVSNLSDNKNLKENEQNKQKEQQQQQYDEIDMVIQQYTNKEKSWWKRSIQFYREETYVNLVRRIMEEKYNQTAEYFEKYNLPLFKTYSLPLNNLRNNFSFKKFQVEFINIINKYDKSKLYSNSLSIKLVLVLPKDYLTTNFKNTFQKVSMKEMSEKLNKEYNKLIQLFPDQQKRHIEKEQINNNQEEESKQNKKSIIERKEYSQHHKNSRTNKNDFLENNNINNNNNNNQQQQDQQNNKSIKDQFDNSENQYSQSDGQKDNDNSNNGQAINVSTMNRNDKVISYQDIIQSEEMENSIGLNPKFDNNLFNRQDSSNAFTPKNNQMENNNNNQLIGNQSKTDDNQIITYYPSMQSQSRTVSNYVNPFAQSQNLVHFPQKLTTQSKSNSNMYEMSLKEKYLLDDYFSPTIKMDKELRLIENIQDDKQKSNNKGSKLYQSKNNENRQMDRNAISNSLDDYFNYNKLNVKKSKELSENYFDYKDVRMKQTQNLVNNYFDNKQYPSYSSVSPMKSYHKCPKCQQEINIQNSKYYQYPDDFDPRYQSQIDFMKSGRTGTQIMRFDSEQLDKNKYQQFDINNNNNNNNNSCKHPCHHHTISDLHNYNSTFSHFNQQIGYNSQFKIDQGMSRIDSELALSASNSEQSQFQKVNNHIQDQNNQKKNVQLLDMLVKRNFIFPQNTIINVV